LDLTSSPAAASPDLVQAEELDEDTLEAKLAEEKQRAKTGA
jgi:hypothetical protein